MINTHTHTHTYNNNNNHNGVTMALEFDKVMDQIKAVKNRQPSLFFISISIINY
ncbi:hypothetical protein BB561_004473 [Smittium simulii]|uniref:Uncharacterized protein n=1 Tax=Smittium simulii TaxID=133385 RepID=A0A2T9YG60_9FUNG|nr:hypothetical protein BB561_004473 [Smittium simulii]